MPRAVRKSPKKPVVKVRRGNVKRQPSIAAPVAVTAPEGEEAEAVDLSDLLHTRLRQTEDLVRKARVRVQGAFDTQAPEALHDLQRARLLMQEVINQLIALGVEQRDFIFEKD